MSSNMVSENHSAETATDGALSPDDLLPPVEPPSAGFILQLFIVPAAIVASVGVLWLLVTTLATGGEKNPDKIVGALRSSNQARWQQAKDLADMLRLPRHYPELRKNENLASKLAQLLNEEVEAGHDDENSEQLRYFLCRVLGEFHVDEGLSVLLKAAREDVDPLVRRQAINALAVLAHTFNTLDPPMALEDSSLQDTFAQLAAEKNDLLRSQTAFALGVFSMQPAAAPQFTEQLELLADDLFADARYNAALALARTGNARAAEALVEMLQPEAIGLSVAREESSATQIFKRNTLLRNALEGIAGLLEKNSQLDRSALLTAVRQFVGSAHEWKAGGDLPKELVTRAEELLVEYGVTVPR
ncbi:MAG: hypothetical protein MK171_01360 [Pirellulales bacterium]|nr:hypothetical protein [Pirellulales bacterium]